jgi:acyl-homoserine lactone synthase
MLVRLIDSTSRLKFSKHLVEMHHDRKRVFVDQLGWELRAPGSWLEVDEFDTEYTVYLVICSSDDERHLASVRLNPTTRPHMLNTIFDHLCDGGPVIGPDVWESSRFTIAPLGFRGTEVMRLSQYLALAHAEFAVMNGITRYTMIGETHRVATVVSMGWPVRPLCLPKEVGGDRVQALEVTVDEQILAQMRARFRVGESILGLEEGRQRWAA